MSSSNAARRWARFGIGLTAGAVTTVGLVCAATPAHAAEALVTPVDVNTDATRATGHNDFLADGVHVWTEGATSTDKAAGYIDVHQPLADVGEPSLDWVGTLPATPGTQLTTDFDGDGDVDGILVGEPAYGGNWWVGSIQDQSVFDAPNTPPTTGGGGGTYNGTLDEWRAAYPDAQVIQSGWSLGSGVHGDGTLYGITVGDTDYVFTNDQADTTKVLHPNDVVHPDTRATGHNDFRLTSGVRVWTEGSTSTDKADGYFSTDVSFDSVGEPKMDWRARGTTNTVKPGLQLLVDIDGDGAPDGTLVSEPTYANGTTLYKEPFGLTNWWLTNGSSPALKALAPTDCSPSGCGYGSPYNGSLAEWRDALPAQAKVVGAGWSLGSGVKGDGIINSITVGLTTYTFKEEAPTDEAELTPVDVNTDATRATGHNDFLADGVHVWTEGATSTDKAAGYIDVHQPLADVGEPSLDWVGTLPATPGTQLTTDFDGDGDVDGILVGEPAYGGNWWVGSIQDQSVFDAPNTPPTTGGGGGTYNGTLDEWRAAYPDAQVIQSGWSLGSGVHGDGTLYGITVGDTDYVFTNDQADTTKVLHPNDVVHPDTRATGHNDFRLTSGVRVWTEGSTSTDKADGYFSTDVSFDSVGEPKMDWRARGTTNTVKPGLQLLVDIDGDGAPDGTLVSEPTYANGTTLYKEPFGLTNWWLTNGSSPALKALAPTDCSPSGCGYGSPYNGSLAEWRDALPAQAKVVGAGWSLGSGVKGDGIINSITVGLRKYTFSGANQAPVAPDAAVSTVAGGSISFPLPATDGDGDPLTYTIDGQADADGVLDHTFARRFVGTKTFGYTATDSHGASDSGTVTVTVRRAPSTTTIDVYPQGRTITTVTSIGIRVKVASTGYTNGTSFVVKVDGKQVGTGELDGDANVWFKIGQLPAGSHTITALVRTGTFALGSTASVDVDVQPRS
ncbi:Ig-like domain-containing protein [Nocardioides sp. MH1]|uniref:Ig-like domain-containing protein n=1 Tax=Nocardioides sp. MH1 TaxID=3242490 RepID=UPI0035213E89